MTTTTDPEPLATVCFSVNIDGIALGTFTSCDGLGVEVVLEQREEGGNNAFVWQLPTRLKYPNIKLSRALGKDSSKVAEWFAKVATGLGAGTGTIVARSADDQAVAHWNLTGVVPVRWTGPSFSLDSPKIAMETIEIAHHGFTFDAA